jgi:hypothetical protein
MSHIYVGVNTWQEFKLVSGIRLGHHTQKIRIYGHRIRLSGSKTVTCVRTHMPGKVYDNIKMLKCRRFIL